MSDLTTFYIVRHGTTEWNTKGLIQGHSDSPLTNEGIEIAKNLAKKFKELKFDKVFSSDLLRAKRTAEILALEHKLEVETTHLLRERDYGNNEGTPYENSKKVDDILDKLTEEERYVFRSGEYVESDKDIVERFLTFIREVSIAYPGKTILAVAHGGIMRAVLMKLGYGTYVELKHRAVKNGAWVKIKSDGVDFFIEHTEGVVKNG